MKYIKYIDFMDYYEALKGNIVSLTGDSVDLRAADDRSTLPSSLCACSRFSLSSDAFLEKADTDFPSRNAAKQRVRAFSRFKESGNDLTRPGQSSDIWVLKLDMPPGTAETTEA